MSIKVTLRGAIEALENEVNGAEIVLAPLPYSIVHPHIAELRRIIGQFVIVECELEDAMGLHEQAPAQPLDELRSVPGAEEDAGINSDDEADETFVSGDETDEDFDAEPDADPVVTAFEPEIHEGFTKWEGGTFDDFCAVQTVYVTTRVEAILRSGERIEALATDCIWERHDDFADIIAYRIIEAPASEQDGIRHMDEGEQQIMHDALWKSATVIRLTPAPEQDASVEIEPTTDLWQQGYDDKLNGFDPALAEPDYLKGYEARKAIEDEQAATYEQAKFFAEGMMADADRHAKHDGPFAWLRKKEPA